VTLAIRKDRTNYCGPDGRFAILASWTIAKKISTWDCRFAIRDRGRAHNKGYNMTLEVKVPVLPESTPDATIASWHKKLGDASGATRIWSI
jgi:hypothetical protein